MPRSKAVSVEALEPLGANRLAALLAEHAEHDPLLRKKLRLALAGGEGPARLAHEVIKRLRTVGRSRSIIAWDKLKPYLQDLDHLRATIAGPLAEQDAVGAAERMWEFLGLAGGIIERSMDGGQRAAALFRQAVQDLGRLCAAAPPHDRASLARRALAAMAADGYGVTDGLLPALGDALGREGRAEARRLLEQRIAGLPPPAGDREAWQVRRERTWVAHLLGQLADLEDDADAYIAAVKLGGVETIAAPDVAERLIAARRAAEALIWLDRAPQPPADPFDTRVIDLRIAALEALGRNEEAQEVRWSTFSRLLSVSHLREHLRRLPDFEDFEAEQRAFALALAHPGRHRALAFLVAWPNLEAADRLVRSHIAEFDGRDYVTLRPAAEALAEKYPAAATLLHRRLAEDVLDRAASGQYEHAARDAAECARLAPRLPADVGIESHDAFVDRLRRQHGRKYKFWHLLRELTTP